MERIQGIRNIAAGKGSHGFTLLEIMVAVAIIGGLLVTLIYTLNYHLSIAGGHERTTVATLLARDKLRELKKNRTDMSGKFSDPYAEYSFAAKLGESSFPGMSELSVTVTVGKDKEQFSLTDLVPTPK